MIVDARYSPHRVRIPRFRFQSETKRGVRALASNYFLSARVSRHPRVPVLARCNGNRIYARREICNAGIRISLFASQIPEALETQPGYGRGFFPFHRPFN